LSRREPPNLLGERCVEPQVQDFFQLLLSCHTLNMAYQAKFVKPCYPGGIRDQVCATPSTDSCPCGLLMVNVK
jgi:hypothetical protein